MQHENMKAGSVDWGLTIRIVDVTTCSTFLSHLHLFLPETHCSDLVFFPPFSTDIKTLQRLEIHACGGGDRRCISQWEGGGVRGWQCNKRVWYRKTLLTFCMPPSKLFYSKLSYVAHRFKLAWALRAVKSWDHIRTHRHSQILPYECMWKHRGQQWTLRCNKTITTTSWMWANNADV